MGIASRRKWSRRIQHPTITTRAGERRPRMVDAVKLARRRALLPSTRTRTPLMAAARYRRMEKAQKAAAKHQGHIIRRRKAARLNGWRPYAQR